MKKTSLLLLTLLTAGLSQAQYNKDFGIKLGMANYLGEIGGGVNEGRRSIADMRFDQTSFAVGGFARLRLSNLISANVGVMYGRITGDDQKSGNPGRAARNLSFRNDILEAYARGEATVYTDNDVGGRGWYRVDFRSFVFAGVAAFRHNPQAQLNGTWHDLRPLKTEGQESEYSSMGIGLPVGLGLYFTLSRKYRIGWEVGYRFTFTDYLDDVSTVYPDSNTFAGDPIAQGLSNRTTQEVIDGLDIPDGELPPNLESFAPGEKRGDPDRNDGYLFSTFNFSIVMRGKSNFYRQKYSWVTNKRRKGRKSRAKF